MTELKEGNLVYTDKGIERVHWCYVDGEKELVTPKGFILADVPSAQQYFQTTESNAILSIENIHLKKLLREVRIYVYIATQYYDNQPVVDTVALKLLGEIDRLLGDKTDAKELEK